MNTQHPAPRVTTLAALHQQIAVMDHAIRIAEGDTVIAPGVPPVSLRIRRDRARAELAGYLRSIRGAS